MKKVLLMAMIALVAISSSRAATINWTGTFLLGSDSYVHDGKTLQDNWHIALYQGSTLTVDINNLDEGKLSYSTAVGIQGFPVPAPGRYVRIDPLSNLTIADNLNIYTVIFDNADYNVATNYAIIDSSVFNVGNNPNPINYSPNLSGSTISINGNWQAIPEPTTFLLFAMGGFGAWLVRRNKLKVKEEV